MIPTKICGITNVPDARAAICNGASAIGFIFYEQSPRAISIEKGNLILPLKIDRRSDINAEEVAPGPAPSPCRTLSPTGSPCKITAFITPETFAI